jgi:hypothetical protein
MLERIPIMYGLRPGKNFPMLLQHWSGAAMRLAFSGDAAHLRFFPPTAIRNQQGRVPLLMLRDWPTVLS